MSASPSTSYCGVCQLHADACECEWCADCAARIATIFGVTRGFCDTCRSACVGCCSPVAPGTTYCMDCTEDALAHAPTVPPPAALEVA